MNIGIDITSAIYQRGVSRYTTNLARNLAKEPEIQLSLFASSFRQKQFLNNIATTIPHSQKTILSLPQGVLSKLWQAKLSPISKHLKNLDIFHSWDWIQPPDTNIPIVSTIHDLAILKFPKTAHPKILKFHQRSWDKLRANKSHIIAVSRATKKDIMELLGFPSYLVHVVHEALPEEFKAVSDNITEEKAQEIRDRLKLNKPYIFFVGTKEPRKNLVRLIEAWQELAVDYDLVIAGDDGWDNSEEKAQEFKHQPRFLGRVSDEELSVLYSLASCFAYPSLYEGFGLPILESFYLGTPVLTSNNSGMLEVAGNATELIDPTSTKSIALGLKKLLSETKEEQHKRMQRMIIRQQMFSWKKVARETIAVYKQAIRDFTK